MKIGKILFGTSLLAFGAAWGAFVFPVLGEESRRAAAPKSATPALAVDADAVLLTGTLEDALRDLPRSPPEGIRADGNTAFAGTVPWDRVPDFMEWVEGLGRPVSEVEVVPDDMDLARARCRVVLEEAR
jgi:hypothetical protein